MNPERSARPATPEDGDFLFRLYATTRADEVAGFGWPPEQQERFLRMQYRASRRSYSATYPEAEHRILLEQGVAAGAMIVARGAGEIRLVDIALLPDYRNYGYGTHEISILIGQARSSGLALRLAVRQGNPAIRLYQRLGFVPQRADAMYIEMEYRPA